jgi:hypothetical protein
MWILESIDGDVEASCGRLHYSSDIRRPPGGSIVEKTMVTTE